MNRPFTGPPSLPIFVWESELWARDCVNWKQTIILNTLYLSPFSLSCLIKYWTPFYKHLSLSKTVKCLNLFITQLSTLSTSFINGRRLFYDVTGCWRWCFPPKWCWCGFWGFETIILMFTQMSKVWSI